MPKKKIVQPQDKLPSSEQSSQPKNASFKVMLSVKNQIKEKEKEDEINLLTATPAKRTTKSTYRVLHTEGKPVYPSPPHSVGLETNEKHSRTTHRSVIKPTKSRVNSSKNDKTAISPDNNKKGGQFEVNGKRGLSPASSTTHKKVKNTPTKTSTKGNKKKSDSPEESLIPEGESNVVEEVVPKRGRGRPRIHKIDDSPVPIKKPKGKSKKQAAKDSLTLITSESEEAEEDEDEDQEGSDEDFDEEEAENEEDDEIEKENKVQAMSGKRSAKQAELDGKTNTKGEVGERKKPGRPRKLPKVINDLSEDEEGEENVEEEEKTLLQTKQEKKEKEKAQYIRNNLVQFPESQDDVEKAVLEAVNDFKANHLEQQILELLAQKFENVNQTNVKNIMQNLDFDARIKNSLADLSRKKDETLVKTEEVHSAVSLEEVNTTAVVKEKKRGRKKKEVIEETETRMKIEEDQGTKVEEDSKEGQTSGQDVQIVKVEVPQPKKRGRPKKIVEEINNNDESLNRGQNEERVAMEIETVEKKDEENEIISKIEEGETGEVAVKRKRGRPPKSKTTDQESEAIASDGNNFMTKQEENVTKEEFVEIQTPVKKQGDETKVEHQNGGGQNVPKKRGRPKLNKEESSAKEAKIEVEVPHHQVIESDKKAKKPTEKSSYESPLKKEFEKTLKEIILLSTPQGVLEKKLEETGGEPTKEEKAEGEKPKRGRKPKVKTEILVIDSVEKEQKTVSRTTETGMIEEEPKQLEGDGVEKTPKKKGRKPKVKPEEGSSENAKLSEEQGSSESTEENKENEKDIKKPIEIDLTSEAAQSAKSTLKKSLKKNESEDKPKKLGRPPKVQEGSDENAKKAAAVAKTNEDTNNFDSLKPEESQQDETVAEPKLNQFIVPEDKIKDERKDFADHIHISGGSQSGITTTEKKRRHPGMDVHNEKFKDKLRENLVKYFENERGKAVKDKQQPSKTTIETTTDKVQKNVSKPTVSNPPKDEHKPIVKQNDIPVSVPKADNLIEIEDPTPEKILIEDEKEGYRIPKKSITKSFHENSRTPPGETNMEEEEEEAITIKTTPRDKEILNISSELHTENQKDVSSIQSPGEYLNMDTDPFLNSGMEADIKKDWLKQDEMFSEENGRRFNTNLMELEHKGIDNKDNQDMGDFEPGKVKKLKIQDEDEAIMRSMSRDVFPLGDVPDSEYSISQFLN